MGLFKRIVSQQIQFFLIVHRFGAFNEVAFHVFFGKFHPFLDVLPNQTGRLVRVRTRLVTDAQVEFEALGAGRFQGRHPVEEVNRFRP